MFTHIIGIGDKVELSSVMYEHENVKEIKQYVSQVLDLQQDSKVIISAPMENTKIIPLEPQHKYQLCFYTKKGLYQCFGEVIKRYMEKNIHILEIEFLSPLEKNQRREYYRLEYVHDMQYRIMEDEMDKQELEDSSEVGQCVNWEKGILTDISGGGIRFISNTPYDKGKKIIVSFSFSINGKNHDFQLNASIISSVLHNNRPDCYQNRVEFFDIDLSNREQIIRFVFEEERKKIRREKGME